MIIIVDAWNLKRSFFSTAAALFCFTTLLNDNRRTKGAKKSFITQPIQGENYCPKTCTEEVHSFVQKIRKEKRELLLFSWFFLLL